MPAVLILVSAVLYGVSPILAKVAYGYGVSTLTLLALRSTFATACLWLGLAASGTPIRFPGPQLALVAFPASSASVLVYTFPLHVAWMGWIFLRERVRPDEVGVLIAVVAGALLVAGQTPLPVGGNLQLVALAVSTLTAALYMVVARRIVRNTQPVAAMAILAPASALTYWAVGLAAGQIRLAMPPAAIAATLGSAALANVAAPLLLLSALQSVPAARAAMLGTLEPVVTVSLSVLFLGDTMTALRALGIAIVIGGIAVLQVRRSSETAQDDRS
jgi:drug/metabolite transporter (DMT)-like permease